MLSRLFSTKGRGREGGQKRARPAEKIRGTGTEAVVSQVVNAAAERQLYRYDMPTQERGMTDLIQSHKTGGRFQYAALTGSDVEEHSSRIRRLIMTRPIYSKSEIPLKDIPRLRLHEDSERFPLSKAIGMKGKEFILLNKATIVFTPLTSFADNYTTMKISLMDMRVESDKERSSIKANTNVQVKCEFSMDHCVPRTDIDEVFLMVTREVSHVSSGRMWGVIQVQLEILETDYPFMENMREVIGVLALPSTGLDTFEKDPMHLDITMHNNHRMKMQDMYAAGDIVDETEPMKEKTAKLTYAKSSAAPKSALKRTQPQLIQGEPVVGNWDHIKGHMNTRVPDDQASIEPDDSDMESVGNVSIPDSLSKKQRPVHQHKRNISEVLSDTLLASDSGGEEEEEVPMHNFNKQKIRFNVSDV